MSIQSVAIIMVDGWATIEVTALLPTIASAIASSRILIADEPSRLLTAKAGLPIDEAVTTLASSGRDVMPPRSNIPTKTRSEERRVGKEGLSKGRIGE